MYATSYNIRSQLERRDRAYYRENDTTAASTQARQANNSGDASKLQSITVPVIMPQVEAALSDLQEIFLSGYPIFGTISTPENIDQATQMDTVVGENSVRAGWPLELLKTMRDGLKYDLGAVEVTWQNRKIFAITTPDITNISQAAVDQTYYAGNFMKHLNAYNLILDPRVSPEKNHTEGEIAGYTEMISRIEMKKRMEDLPPLGCMNFKKAFESPTSLGATTDVNAPFYHPNINPDALMNVQNMAKEVNWLAYMNLEPANGNSDQTRLLHKSSYEWTVIYARILPTDFQINSKPANHVQIWKFIIVNRHTVIFAERQTNAHNYLPIIICKPSADPMGWQAKSFAENAMPYQAASSALLNSGIESQRRKVYDRIFYDPSKINKKDIDAVSSVARIAVKNSAYGKPIGDAVHVVAYNDNGVAEVLQMSQNIASMADIGNGQNRVTQGQFQKGNKTRAEFETTMGNAGGRSRMRALALEYSFFVPIKEIIKSNILQYQQPGTLQNRDSNTSVEIDPQKLRTANLSFALSDGYLPSEKMVGTDTFATIFQAAPALPTLNMEYDLMGMFIYSQKLKGANWLNSFKRTPEQQQAQLAQLQGVTAAQGGSAKGAAPQAKPPAS